MSKTQLPIILGKKIKQLRNELKLNQTDFGKLFHLSQNDVTKIECGDKSPTYATLLDIADYCNVTTDYLLKPNGVREENIQLQQICDYTGLSEETINELAKRKQRISNIKYSYFDAEDKQSLIDTFINLYCQQLETNFENIANLINNLFNRSENLKDIIEITKSNYSKFIKAPNNHPVFLDNDPAYTVDVSDFENFQDYKNYVIYSYIEDIAESEEQLLANEALTYLNSSLYEIENVFRNLILDLFDIDESRKLYYSVMKENRDFSFEITKSIKG